MRVYRPIRQFLPAHLLRAISVHHHAERVLSNPHPDSNRENAPAIPTRINHSEMLLLRRGFWCAFPYDGKTTPSISVNSLLMNALPLLLLVKLRLHGPLFLSGIHGTKTMDFFRENGLQRPILPNRPFPAAHRFVPILAAIPMSFL